MIGNINKLTSSQKSGTSTLKVEINKFMIFIFSLAGAMAAIFFALGMTVGLKKYASGYDIKTRVINSISNAFVAVLVSLWWVSNNKVIIKVRIPAGIEQTKSMHYNTDIILDGKHLNYSFWFL